MQHNIDDLIALFNGHFGLTENTVLVAGGDEPIYLPADADHPQHRIIFAHGFFASALHELAHWCIAGLERRLQVDYGYWYHPDGRDASQQLAFAEVEAKPQALECLLAQAAGHPFVISLDNLSGEEVDTTPFRQAVLSQIQVFQRQGVNNRTLQLIQLLADYYQQSADYQHYLIRLEDLR